MNNQINSIIFSALHSILNKKDLILYRQLLRNNDKSFEALQHEQNKNLQKIIDYSYNNVPYYNSLFKKSGITPSDIKEVKDLELLPIIDKATIRTNFNNMLATGYNGKYYDVTTGGSTGVPLKYRTGELDRALGFALCYRGWNYGGYTPGASLLVLGGGSLVSKNLNFRKRMYHKIKNHYIASSYGMDDDSMQSLIHLIDMKKIKYIRGYATSLFLLASWMKDNDIPLHLTSSVEGIYTTSEMLFPRHRKLIEEVFKVKVYDGYGLNDGGVSAYEDGSTEGYLIDTERAVLECVDDNGKQITGKPGRIIATNLFNYPMPFLRYDTGDLGIASDEYIRSGGNRYMLKNLLGRTNDYLEINGKKISSSVLTVLMGKINAHRYQFIQTGTDTLEIIIEKDEHYGSSDEQFMKESIMNHVGKCIIHFNYSGKFHSSGNKHKFIIRKT